MQLFIAITVLTRVREAIHGKHFYKIKVTPLKFVQQRLTCKRV